MIKKFLAALIFVAMFCGVSSAHFIYSTTGGELGLVSVYGPESIDLEGVQYESDSVNPIISAYWDHGKARVIFVEPNSDENDKALRFNSNNLTKPIDSKAFGLKDVSNTKQILSTSSGNGIFFVLDKKIQELDTEDFEPQRSYEHSGDSEMKKAIIFDQRIFVLIGDELLRFDGQLSTKPEAFGKWEIKPEATTITNVTKESLAIGYTDGVELWEDGSVVDLLRTEAPVVAMCNDGGEGFYYITQSTEDGVTTNSLYHYHSSTSDFVAATEGTAAELSLDKNRKVLAAIMDDSIKFYNTSDSSFIKEFTADELGGTPYKLAIGNATGRDEDTGGSSCNISGLGILLLITGYGFVIIARNHFISESR